MQAGRGGRAALAVNGGVVLEGRCHGRVALGQASQVCCEGAAGGCVLWGPALFGELQDGILFLKQKWREKKIIKKRLPCENAGRRQAVGTQDSSSPNEVRAIARMARPHTQGDSALTTLPSKEKDSCSPLAGPSAEPTPSARFGQHHRS